MPRLLTPCLISEAWDSNGPIAKPVAKEYQALWDTGANRSSITSEVVSSLGLVNTTYTDVEHAGGITPDVPVYLVNITLLNRVEIVGVEVTTVQLPSNVNALIGMDIINAGDFAISNQKGKTTFSFRIPSKHEIDFVTEDDRTNLVHSRPSPSRSKHQRNKGKRKK